MAIADPGHMAGSGALHADRFDLSIGSVSVGLPLACTTDIVLLRYLDLLRLVRRDGSSEVRETRGDLEQLVEATSLRREVVLTRLRALRGGGDH